MDQNRINDENSRSTSQNKVTNEPHIRDEDDSSDDSEDFNNFYIA
jgi:hypothetical protein